MTSFAVFVAAIEILAPAQDATIPLLPDCQRAVITNEMRVAREAALEAFKNAKDWLKSRDVSFSWRATAGEHWPWEFSISTNSDMSDARVEYIRMETNAQGVVRYTLPRANLEIGTRYHWQVRSKKAEAIGSFVTEDLAPRWIEIEGRVRNFRDLGGRIGLDGKRVRQGMIYRSQGLNDNSVGGKHKGRNRLMVEDVAYLTGTLGIRTDLDLRSSGETANMTNSPLGVDVNFVHHSSLCYSSIFSELGKKVMAENFRVFCDEKNYPILFHCIAGADRTGALAYVLNGVLGVSRQELETDWESTFYPRIPYKDDKGNFVCNSEGHFDEGFSKYGAEGDSWNRRIERYLLDCGIREDEIEKFRSIMLK